MNSNRSERLAFLDSLRGFAAVYVLAFHVARAPNPVLPVPSWMAAFVSFGYTGVTLFFVLSAFSLCLTMPRHKATVNPLTSFALSRAFRIIPIFYLLLCVHLFRLWYIDHPIDPVGVGLTASLLFNLSPRWCSSMVGAGWTVGAEVLFYAMFPAIFVACRNRIDRLTYLLAGAFAVTIAFSSLPLGPHWAKFKHLSVIGYLPVFLIGMLAFESYRRLNTRRDAGRIGWALFALGFGVLVFQFGFLKFARFSPYAVIEGVGYGLVACGAGLINWRGAWTRIPSFYGRISYSVYLWHTLLIWLMGDYLHAIYHLRLPLGFKYAVCFGVVLSAATAVSFATYEIIERPMELLGRRIIARLGSRQIPAAVAV